MKNYKQSVTVSGTVTESDIYFHGCGHETGCSGGQYSEGPGLLLIYDTRHLNYVDNNYPMCNQHYAGEPQDWTQDQKNSFTAWTNSYFAKKPVFFLVPVFLLMLLSL